MLSLITNRSRSWALLGVVLFALIPYQEVRASFYEHSCKVLARNALKSFQAMSQDVREHEQRIGPNHLVSDVLKSLKDISFIELNEFVKPPQATRWTAFSDPGSKTIYWNRQAAITEIGFPFICLHEVLQAVGVEDSNYQRSTLLLNYIAHALTVQEEFRFRDASLLTWGQQLEQKLPDVVQDEVTLANGRLQRGGGDLVGGGGEILAVQLKQVLFRKMFPTGRLALNRYEDVSDVLNLPLEIYNGDGILYMGVSPASRLGERIYVSRKLAQAAVDAADPSAHRIVIDLSFFLQSVSLVDFLQNKNMLMCRHPAAVAFWYGQFGSVENWVSRPSICNVGEQPW